MSDKKVNVAVAGATGAVGNQMIRCLEEADFPARSVKFLASSRSVGRTLRYKGDMIAVEELKELAALADRAIRRRRRFVSCVDI